MKTKLNRRDFFIKGTQAGVAGCALFMGIHKLAAMEGINRLLEDDEPIDPTTLNFCGYKCPENCPWLRGSWDDNINLKKEGYEQWGIKKRYDIEFDPETMFCYGCKAEGKPDGFILKKCNVRTCCKEKGFDCCIECKELTTCGKDLWGRFPDFHKAVIEMQAKYRVQQG